jgi:cyclopropane fatty-acyl-phospholipid synthase-like methyltransferase
MLRCGPETRIPLPVNTSGPPSSTEFGNLEANLRFLEDTALLAPGVRILEIGCGRGGLLRALAARGLDIVGVETSAERIAESRSAYGALPIRPIVGATLPFPESSFDIVLSFDVFEHIPNSGEHLAEVRRVLRPGGWYLLQTPNKWTNAIFETIRWRSVSRWKADHCSLHSCAQLRRRLQTAGFEPAVVDVKVVTPFFRDKVRRYLGVPGVLLLKLVNPDRLPLPLRTNFYVKARRKS